MTDQQASRLTRLPWAHLNGEAGRALFEISHLDRLDPSVLEQHLDLRRLSFAQIVLHDLFGAGCRPQHARHHQQPPERHDVSLADAR